MNQQHKMQGIDKAAMFLLSLGPELSGPIMKTMNDDSLVQIAKRMPCLTNITPDMLNNLFREYRELHNSGIPTLTASTEEVHELLKNVVDEERLQHILESLGGDGKSTGIPIWNRISHMKPKRVYSLIKNENPQTIAIILGHLDSGIASKLIEFFPEEMQMAVVLRMSKIESVSTDLIADIENTLGKQLTDTQGDSGLSFDGMVRVVEILKTLDSKISKPILDHLREKDLELFEQVDSQLLVFEDFSLLSDRDIQTVLKHVSSEDLIRALKGSSDEIRDHFFANMSQRAAEVMREDMEVMGPLKVSDVETSQRNIMENARKLDQEGAISMGKQEEMIY